MSSEKSSKVQDIPLTGTGYNKEYDEASRAYEKLLDASSEAMDEYERQLEAYNQAEEELRLYKQVVEEMPGDIDKYTDSTKAAADATAQFSVESKEAEKAVKR